MIAVFDIAGPLVAYGLLRSAGFSPVAALVLSGVFPAAGVIIESLSQKPSGVGSGQDMTRLFNRFRDNHIARFALRCATRDVSMAVMGNESYGEGYDASGLPLGDDRKGIGILYGLEDDAPTVRTYLADSASATDTPTA